MSQHKNNKAQDPIFYGGQALIEGVMMRGKKSYALAVRRPDGEIELIDKPLSKASSNALLKLPIIRGIAAFCSSMVVGYSALARSAEIAMEEEETGPPGKFEAFMLKTFGDKLNKILMTISMVVAVIFALGLFMLLPTWIGTMLSPIVGPWIGVVEGLVRILIFVAYVFLISRARDIQRVFQYHGAEHKAINCYEQGMPLTTENVNTCSRLHKRCGTSFLLVVMVISMVLFMILRIEDVWLRFGSRILLLPLIAGLAYEVSVKWAGKRDNVFVSAITIPGMALQRMTTGEPDDQQIEVAIKALKQVAGIDNEDLPIPTEDEATT
ncbi:MAG: DUF1385 domain-containing protein [Defluviitaleaceae bacterium]|nr:DUF1385 domain-containing protein [Defluviitaleaceae bacterium]